MPHRPHSQPIFSISDFIIWSSSTLIFVICAVGVLFLATNNAAAQDVDTEAAKCGFQRNLSVGVSGADVRCLQEYLTERGYFGVTPTGYFGPMTRQAVLGWQRSRLIFSGNGSFGPLSRSRYGQKETRQSQTVASSDKQLRLDNTSLLQPETRVDSQVDSRSSVRRFIMAQLKNVLDKSLQIQKRIALRGRSEAGASDDTEAQSETESPENNDDDLGESTEENRQRSFLSVRRNTADKQEQGENRVARRAARTSGSNNESANTDDDTTESDKDASDANKDNAKEERDTTPPIITNADSTANDDTVTISWTTDEPASSWIDYGSSNRYGSSVSSDALTTSHSLDITNLLARGYNFRISSTDESGNREQGSNQTFTIVDLEAPVISNVNSVAGRNTITVTWETDEPADSEIKYGTTLSLEELVTDRTDTTDHALSITDLSPGTTYYFQVRSTDPAGNIVLGTSQTATTDSGPDTVAPSISEIQVSSADNLATITWTTNEPADSVINYGTTNNYGSTKSQNSLTTDHSIILDDLSADTTFYFQVTSRDSSGNTGISAGQTFITDDTTPPTLANVRSSAGYSGAVIAWETNELATSQVDFGPTDNYGSTITGDGNLDSAHTIYISNLSSGTYHYRVTSVDGSGNSQESTDRTFVVTDNSAPSISNIQTSIFNTTATVSWNTNEPADSVLRYGQTESYGSTVSDNTMETAHSLTMNNLFADTRYHFQIQSSDVAGNTGNSGNNTLKTQPELDTDGPISTTPDSNSVLPQNEEWQIVLRNYMKTLDESDFAIQLEPYTWDESDYDSLDELYQQFLATVEGSDFLNSQARYFTLGEIEKNDNVWSFMDKGSGFEGAAGLTEIDIPGNPHYKSRALKLRTFMTAAVDMMMLHEEHQTNGSVARSDFLGGTMNQWTYVFLNTQDAVPAQVKNAMKQGLLTHLVKLENWGPTDVNTNMDTKAVPAMYRIGKIFNTNEMWTRVTNNAKRWLFGSANGTAANSDGGAGIFHAAGYVGEANGPETTYNGIALYYLTDAAMQANRDGRWPFMQEVIERMVKFKSYQYFKDPDGILQGPSSYAKRTASGYPNDQRDPYYRDLSTAILTDEGKHLISYIYDERQRGMLDEPGLIERMDRKANGAQWWGDFTVSSDATPEVWEENHWGTNYNYLYSTYPAGTYQELYSEWQNSPDNFQSPINRFNQYSVNFNDEYWAGKSNDGSDGFSWNIETFPDAGWGYDSSFLGGGSLTGFWTEDSGIVLLGKARGANAYKRRVNGQLYGEKDTFPTVRRWATHHMYGFGNNGEPFSTAKNRHAYSSYNSTTNPTEVTVVGGIGDGANNDDSRYDYDRWAPDGALSGLVEYSRTFKKTSSGLEVTSRMNINNASESVSELWEVLPIFLYEDTDWQDANLVNPQIDFRVNGSWRSASNSLVTADAVRITRFDNPAYIVFNQPQQMRVRAETWFTPYQTSNRIKHLEINMLDATGSKVSLPSPATISYEIRPNL